MDAAVTTGQTLLLDRITHRYAGHPAVDGVMLDIASAISMIFLAAVRLVGLSRRLT